MGTRSIIAVMHGDVAKAVYCHWDGYLSYVGKILQEHYADSGKVNHLISLGDISSLGPEIGTKHPFDNIDAKVTYQEFKQQYGHMTTFYGRDHGETNVGFQVLPTWAELLEYADSCSAEFVYVQNQGVWYVFSPYNNVLELLTEALDSHTDLDD